MVPGALSEDRGNGGSENTGGGEKDQIGAEPVVRLLQQPLEHLRGALSLLCSVFNPVAVHGEHRDLGAGRECDDHQQEEQRAQQSSCRGVVQGSVPRSEPILPDYNRRPPFTFSEASNAMFDNLTSRLSRTIETLRGRGRITEDNIGEALREVRVALLEADVALPVIKTFIEAVKAKALGAEVASSLTPGQAFIGILHRELVQLMGGPRAGINLRAQPPIVVLLAGLQGAG